VFSFEELAVSLSPVPDPTSATRRSSASSLGFESGCSVDDTTGDSADEASALFPLPPPPPSPTPSELNLLDNSELSLLLQECCESFFAPKATAMPMPEHVCTPGSSGPVTKRDAQRMLRRLRRCRESPESASTGGFFSESLAMWLTLGCLLAGLTAWLLPYPVRQGVLLPLLCAQRRLASDTGAVGR
jgi:hypothetical protein